jgi:hypothetical protein
MIAGIRNMAQLVVGCLVRDMQPLPSSRHFDVLDGDTECLNQRCFPLFHPLAETERVGPRQGDRLDQERGS